MPAVFAHVGEVAVNSNKKSDSNDLICGPLSGIAAFTYFCRNHRAAGAVFQMQRAAQLSAEYLTD